MLDDVSFAELAHDDAEVAAAAVAAAFVGDFDFFLEGAMLPGGVGV